MEVLQTSALPLGYSAQPHIPCKLHFLKPRTTTCFMGVKDVSTAGDECQIPTKIRATQRLSSMDPKNSGGRRALRFTSRRSARARASTHSTTQTPNPRSCAPTNQSGVGRGIRSRKILSRNSDHPAATRLTALSRANPAGLIDSAEVRATVTTFLEPDGELNLEQRFARPQYFEWFQGSRESRFQRVPRAQRPVCFVPAHRYKSGDNPVWPRGGPRWPHPCPSV